MALRVDAWVRGKNPECGERIGRVGCKRHLRLIIEGALHTTRAEHVEGEDRNAGCIELLGPVVELCVVNTA